MDSASQGSHVTPSQDRATEEMSCPLGQIISTFQINDAGMLVIVIFMCAFLNSMRDFLFAHGANFHYFIKITACEGREKHKHERVNGFMLPLALLLKGWMLI